MRNRNLGHVEIIRLQRSIAAWGRVERRISLFLQEWTLVVIGAFLVKAWKQDMAWWILAAIAGTHTGIFILLFLVNANRHRINAHRARVEAKSLGDGVDYEV